MLNDYLKIISAREVEEDFLIDYFGSEFGVTGKRVISKKGIISRNASEMNLSSIESVNVDQGIIGRILNYGTVKISGRGTTTVDFKNIS